GIPLRVGLHDQRFLARDLPGHLRQLITAELLPKPREDDSLLLIDMPLHHIPQTCHLVSPIRVLHELLLKFEEQNFYVGMFVVEMFASIAVLRLAVNKRVNYIFFGHSVLGQFALEHQIKAGSPHTRIRATYTHLIEQADDTAMIAD